MIVRHNHAFSKPASFLKPEARQSPELESRQGSEPGALPGHWTLRLIALLVPTWGGYAPMLLE